MVSAIVILVLSGASLLLVWTLLHRTLPEIHSLEDWEAQKREVDVEIFRTLVDPAEERYLRNSLSSPQFRFFQRQRIGLALRILQLIGDNAAMLMRVGQLAKTGADPELARQAEELIMSALRLRAKLVLIQAYLWMKWLFPGWGLAVPGCDTRYRELLHYLSRVRGQGPEAALIAG